MQNRLHDKIYPCRAIFFGIEPALSEPYPPCKWALNLDLMWLRRVKKSPAKDLDIS